MAEVRDYLRFRKDLSDAPSELFLNDNFSDVPFIPAQHVAIARQMLNKGYRNGEGSVLPTDEWWDSVSNDPEYDPDLCFIVMNRSGNPAGFLHCWNSGFIKDVSVAEEFRRFGIARYLLNKTFQTCAKRGLKQVDLKVKTHNQTGAIALYRAMGMVEVSE